MPRPGTDPAMQACALTRNETEGDLLLHGTMPNQLSHISQGPLPIFKFGNLIYVFIVDCKNSLYILNTSPYQICKSSLL